MKSIKFIVIYYIYDDYGLENSNSHDDYNVSQMICAMKFTEYSHYTSYVQCFFFQSVCVTNIKAYHLW